MSTTDFYRVEASLDQMLARQAEFPTVQVAGCTMTLPPERKFADVPSMQVYVDSVLALNWVREQFPRAAEPVTVRSRKGPNRAHYERIAGQAAIAIPTTKDAKAFAMRETTVLHEVAHHLTNDSQHGPAFRTALTELMSEIIGPEVGFILRVLLTQTGS